MRPGPRKRTEKQWASLAPGVQPGANLPPLLIVWRTVSIGNRRTSARVQLAWTNDEFADSVDCEKQSMDYNEQ
jgi:hypothetical protein